MYQKFLITTFFSFLALLQTQAALANSAEKEHSMLLGNATITTLNDVTGEGKTDILIGATSHDLTTYLPTENYTSVINAFLVQSNGKNILIDTGLGKKLITNLNAININAQDIDIILITHMHADHIGGLLNDNGQATFPHSDIYIASKEHAFWQSEETAQQAQTVLNVYKDKIHLFEPSTLNDPANEIVSGITAIAAYGHTPGHTAFLLTSEGSRLLFWGDITHVTPIQFPKPEITVIYDNDPIEAVATRQAILNFVVEQNIPIAGAHVINISRVKTDATNPNVYFLEDLN